MKRMSFPFREHDRVLIVKEIRGKLYIQQNGHIDLIREQKQEKE